MAAYAALISLLLSLDQIKRHPFPPISLDRQQVESLTEIATFLQEFLEGYNSPFVDSDEADLLEMRIADAAYAAEDVIESYIVDNIRFAAAATHDDEVNSSSSDDLNFEVIFSRGSASRFFNRFRGYSPSGELNSEKEINSGEEMFSCVNLYQDVWKVIEEMDLVKKEVMEKTDVQAHQLQTNILKSSSFSGKNSSVMVGFDDVFLQLLDKLTGGPSSLKVIPITGMGGIGKTTLARNIFQHALVKEHFVICAWVTISQEYNTKEILSQILYQASGKSSEKSVEELQDELHKYLFGGRYLIIMDDIWSIEVWKEMRLYFPNCENGSRAVVTTRQSFLTSQLTDSNDIFHMKFLNEVNSWDLFSKTIFEEEGFPPHLEKIGKKIVEKCRGLPLSITVIGGLLAKSQQTNEHWEHIEKKLNSIVNSEYDEYCLKILKLSYNHLPTYLKSCFLYMGSFKEDTRIRVSALIKLWVCQGFIKPENGKSLEIIGEAFLKDLIDRNLILVDEWGKTGNIKYCKMHDLLRDLCMKEAKNERFYHVLGQRSPRGIQNHKRRHMVSDEYGLEDVIYKLVNSRYAAISPTILLESILPSSVIFLWNLHTLRIVWNRFPRIHKRMITAPVEIWKMSQLRHVEFKRGFMYLPDPPSGSSIVILENLQTLKGILNFKCGEEMVKRIPNIKKLQIEYKEIRRHDGDDDYCLSNLHSLHKLESLSIKVHEKDDDFLHNITFPQSLIKLCLELTYGAGVGCEEMLEKIGDSLPFLQKLKLRFGSFKTSKWEIVEGQFPSLKFLELLYCGGLKQWMIEESSPFPCLEHLHLVGLIALEEIPAAIGEIPALKSIELWYCSESAVRSAKKIVEEQEELQGGEEQLPFLVRVEESYKKQEALQSLASPNFQCLSNLHSLHKLESLTMNFYVKDDDFLHNITFPQSLRKLSLSESSINISVGWEEMLEKIGGSLPLLQKLKLEWGVFKTGKWETVEGQFPSLKFLELSYCGGLKQWMIEESSHFPCLEHLHLSGLEELEEIPLEIGEIPTLQSIQLYRCSELAVKSAKKIVEEQEELLGGEEHLHFLVQVVEFHDSRAALQSLASPNFQFEWVQ